MITHFLFDPVDRYPVFLSVTANPDLYLSGLKEGNYSCTSADPVPESQLPMDKCMCTRLHISD